MMRPQPIKPGPGQESVWDYPRPPRLERTNKSIRIVFAGVEIVRTNKALRILETSHPPTYYIPPEDIQMEYLQPAGGGSICEFKGPAHYYDIVVGERRAERAAWAYAKPIAYQELKDYVAFYVAAMDACYVNDEKAEPQPGGFYGGWVTSDVVGPFKGGPGSWGW